MRQSINIHKYDNGLVLLAEPMDWLESAAFALVVPAGCCRDPEDRAGLSNFACEMVQRGCGPRSSRQVVEDLERLGADNSGSVSNAHTSFGAAMPAESLPDVLSIFADVVQQPHLPADQLEDARLVCVQELRAIEDDLAQKAMLELRRRRYPDPYGRSCQGTMESLEQISLQDIANYFQQTYQPQGAILSVAGKIDVPRLRDHVERLFGQWQPQSLPALREIPPNGRYGHIPHESNQTHIAVGYASVPYRDSLYYQARGAVGILSDGMSSRLFTEVREKRGLCYTVYASCHSLRDRGSVVCYAGTTSERAQETLDVVLAELHRLGEGVHQEELDRLKARIKSSLIMQQESSSSRASSMAADYFHLGRVQQLEEVKKIIDDLSCDSINAYLATHPPTDFCFVTLGEQQLEIPVGIS